MTPIELPKVANLATPTSIARHPIMALPLTMLLSGMAGGLAWGIRGQYGHETGAMIAGVLVGFTLLLLWGRHLSSLTAARAIALFTLGVSVGGSMTYGQTVGLTQDGPLVGNVDAYRWGMLGLAIKGAIWIGMGGALLGMGLGGKRYRAAELLVLLSCMLIALLIGVQLLNRPYQPEARLLPKIYFSDHWHWESNVDKPRQERWGGLACALGLLWIYLLVWKRDVLASWLTFWSLLAGAVGFPAGQSVQAAHAWYPDYFAELPTHGLTQYFNWWNMMETTFGAVFGAILGAGLWLHRRRIVDPPETTEELVSANPLLEWVLLGVYLRALVAVEFQSFALLDFVAEDALPFIILPVLAVATGRFWPFLACLPITLLPIAGKTVRQLVFREGTIEPTLGWEFYFVLPLWISFTVAIYFGCRATAQSGRFLAIGLLLSAWSYFLLNFAFFHFPWPWQPWTGRTPNAILFLMSLLSLTCLAVRHLAWSSSSSSDQHAAYSELAN